MRQDGLPAAPTEIIIWTDPRTGNALLLQGKVLAGWLAGSTTTSTPTGVLDWDQTQVNYGPRTWSTYNQHAGGPIQGPVPPGPVGGDYNTPAQIKQWLDQGVGKILGYPHVDGHPRRRAVRFRRLRQDVRDLRGYQGLPGGPARSTTSRPGCRPRPSRPTTPGHPGPRPW